MGLKKKKKFFWRKSWSEGKSCYLCAPDPRGWGERETKIEQVKHAAGGGRG